MPKDPPNIIDKLKEALDEAVHENRKVTPAGNNKTQEEVRSEIHGEERKVHEIQKKTGWSDRVSSLSTVQSSDVDQVIDILHSGVVVLRSKTFSMEMKRNRGSKTNS
jgi:predicted metal-dependent RNase